METIFEFLRLRLFFYSWERAVTLLCEISCFNKFSQYNRCRLSLCFTCVSTVACTVSIAHYVALINFITVQHAQREREDSAERLITLWEGVSTWLSMLLLFEVLLCSPSSKPLSHLFMHHIYSPNPPPNKHTHTNQTKGIIYCTPTGFLWGCLMYYPHIHYSWASSMFHHESLWHIQDFN